MKEDSDQDSGSNNVSISRIVGNVSSLKYIDTISLVTSQPQWLLLDEPPGMEIEVTSSGLVSTTMEEQESIPMGENTLENAPLGITKDVNQGSNGSSGNNGDPIMEGIQPTNSANLGKGLKDENNGRQKRGMGLKCKIFRSKFGYKYSLQYHEHTHTGEKPFECKECNKRFTRGHHLKTHMRLHTGEKPYHCDCCGRQFAQVSNFRKHLRVHTGERPYACTMCSSRFNESTHLKAHLLIHEGIRPFECEKCKRPFRLRHHLSRHKCRGDTVNIGKPRRRLRPKAYEKLPASLPMLSPVLQERRSVFIPILPRPVHLKK